MIFYGDYLTTLFILQKRRLELFKSTIFGKIIMTEIEDIKKTLQPEDITEYLYDIPGPIDRALYDLWKGDSDAADTIIELMEEAATKAATDRIYPIDGYM